MSAIGTKRTFRRAPEECPLFGGKADIAWDARVMSVFDTKRTFEFNQQEALDLFQRLIVTRTMFLRGPLG